MKNMKTLFIGIVVLTVLGWGGLILHPFYQFGNLELHEDEDTGALVPKDPTGLAIRGEQVYLSQGCVYCHTQQVRDPHQGPDLERGWGDRRTVARDYVHSASASLGYMRLGPDLANAGSDMRIIKILKLYEDERFEGKSWTLETPAQIQTMTTEVRDGFSDEEWAEVKTEYAQWLHRHLYNPRSVRDWSNMPAYRSLYKEIPVVGAAAAQAVAVDGDKQAVPTAKAEALVAYLMSLDRSYKLPETTP